MLICLPAYYEESMKSEKKVNAEINCQSILQLPLEIVENEVLSKLDIKTLIELSTTSQSMYNLIAKLDKKTLINAINSTTDLSQFVDLTYPLNIRQALNIKSYYLPLLICTKEINCLGPFDEFGKILFYVKKINYDDGKFNLNFLLDAINKLVRCKPLQVGESLFDALLIFGKNPFYTIPNNVQVYIINFKLSEFSIKSEINDSTDYPYPQAKRLTLKNKLRLSRINFTEMIHYNPCSGQNYDGKNITLEPIKVQAMTSAVSFYSKKSCKKTQQLIPKNEPNPFIG
jgi:F-box domain